MFKRIDKAAGRAVKIEFDGKEISAIDGENLAAALFVGGIKVLRETPTTSAPRAGFCMMGACFDCLVEIDGETVQACMTEVRGGLKVGKSRRRNND